MNNLSMEKIIIRMIVRAINKEEALKNTKNLKVIFQAYSLNLNVITCEHYWKIPNTFDCRLQAETFSNRNVFENLLKDLGGFWQKKVQVNNFILEAFWDRESNEAFSNELLSKTNIDWFHIELA